MCRLPGPTDGMVADRRGRAPLLIVLLGASALGLAVSACGLGGGDEGGGPSTDTVAGDSSGPQWPWYEGSFTVTIIGSNHIAMNPILVRLEARGQDGEIIDDYAGRVSLTSATIVGASGAPEPEAYFTTYDEWGNRPEVTKRGIGGFVGGVGNFPITFVAVRPKEWKYDTSLTVCDLQNTAMCGSASLSVRSIPAGKQEYMELGPDYKTPPLEAGTPAAMRLVARNGQNSLGFELQNLFVGTVELFSTVSKTLTPGKIDDYSKKADGYGVLVHDFTFSDGGEQQMVAVWKTPAGMYRASVSPTLKVAPPPIVLDWKQADLGEMSPVTDIWASPVGTYVTFEFGRLYMTPDGGKTFELVHDFGQMLRGVGHHYQYPDVKDGVCVVADDQMKCDCITCYNWAPTSAFGSSALKKYLCLPGHPNKDMKCYVHPTQENERHIVLNSAWGLQYETMMVTATGGVPQTGVWTGSVNPPWFYFPWALAQDAAQETLYVANRTTTEIAFSTDHGATWGRVMGGLPEEDGISFMTFDERYRTLYVGTDNNGLWFAAVDDVEVAP